MLRRGATSLALAGAVLLAVAVPGAMAAGAQRSTYEVWFAEGTRFDGPTSVDVVAQVGSQDKAAFRELDVNDWTVQADCVDADGNPGTISLNIFGSSTTAIIKFDKKLATVTASGPVSVTETLVNSCTGAETPGATYTVDVSLDLHATSETTSTRSHTETKNADGSKLVETARTDTREAAGTMTVGGTTTETNYGTNITHQTVQDVFTPPHGH